jgi:hypothetical protein
MGARARLGLPAGDGRDVHDRGEVRRTGEWVAPGGAAPGQVADGDVVPGGAEGLGDGASDAPGPAGH